MSTFDSVLEECTLLFETAGFAMDTYRVAVRVAACVHRQLFCPSRPGRFPDDDDCVPGTVKAKLEVQGAWSRCLECLSSPSPIKAFSRLLGSTANTNALFVALVHHAASIQDTTSCWMQTQLLQLLLRQGAAIPRFLHVDATQPFEASSLNDGWRVWNCKDEKTAKDVYLMRACISRHGYNVVQAIAAEATRRHTSASVCSPSPTISWDVPLLNTFCPLTVMQQQLSNFDADSTGWCILSARCVWVTACVGLGVKL